MAISRPHRPVSVAVPPRQLDDPVFQAFTLLRVGFTVAPILFGLDKFLDWLVDWPQYLAPEINDLIPGNAHQAMLAVGVVEIVAGLVVAVPAPRSAATWSPRGWAGSSSTCCCRPTTTTSPSATSGCWSRRSPSPGWPPPTTARPPRRRAADAAARGVDHPQR